MLNPIKIIARHVLRPIRPFLDDFLKNVSLVIHVGANEGQERFLYDSHNLEVIWVEAIPDVFNSLEENIRGFPRQMAFCEVLSNIDGQEVTINVASNNGESSSIFKAKGHLDYRPDITFDKIITLSAKTLTSMLAQKGLKIKKPAALVLDVQGAELLVLQGAEEIIRKFDYIKAEASDGEFYEGSCTPEELTKFLTQRGFKMQRKVVTGKKSNTEKMYDIVFRRIG